MNNVILSSMSITRVRLLYLLLHHLNGLQISDRCLNNRNIHRKYYEMPSYRDVAFVVIIFFLNEMI